jgi:hypothetical protein
MTLPSPQVASSLLVKYAKKIKHKININKIIFYIFKILNVQISKHNFPNYFFCSIAFSCSLRLDDSFFWFNWMFTRKVLHKLLD